jgi:hypothetical protein
MTLSLSQMEGLRLPRRFHEHLIQSRRKHLVCGLLAHRCQQNARDGIHTKMETKMETRTSGGHHATTI